MSDNKNCSCGQCSSCCNGYVRDVKNPNRYVNLETGKVRDLDKKSNKLGNLLFLWLVIICLLALLNNQAVKDCQNNPKLSDGTYKQHCTPLSSR
ncbi:hypothetical protein NIES3974_29900 [Calothrix sp. NIES-3974]|nr:hypothetical protein NIES3974_29900 [Calothrix sp. NIES-3974]